MIARSADGITFSTPEVFQDSSGVPSVIRWRGDTLIAVFQWFRKPDPSPTWDRVAVRFSFDNGWTWTSPVPVIISGMPANFQRPFDPVLSVINSDSLRIYFSSSNGYPAGQGDSIIDTYSARSADGIHYFFEPGPRVDKRNNRVIDPAVIYFKSMWHYLAPIGAPQEGAFHCISMDGINYTPVPDIVSDFTHNWTGNYMVENQSELRFYGCGPMIWYNSSVNGGEWNTYISTNIQGGDPSVVKISEGNYLMLYVGQPYSYEEEEAYKGQMIRAFPNPTAGEVFLMVNSTLYGMNFTLSDLSGNIVLSGKVTEHVTKIKMDHLAKGIYMLKSKDNNLLSIKIIKK